MSLEAGFYFKSIRIMGCPFWDPTTVPYTIPWVGTAQLPSGWESGCGSSPSSEGDWQPGAEPCGISSPGHMAQPSAWLTPGGPQRSAGWGGPSDRLSRLRSQADGPRRGIFASASPASLSWQFPEGGKKSLDFFKASKNLLKKGG